MSKAEHPVSLRVDEEDLRMLAYLKERLGKGQSSVIRFAIRRLYQAEKKLDK